MIGADSLGYLPLENVSKLADNICGFCTACFDGKYACQPPSTPDLSRFERGVEEN